jgi:hypothetical protein
MSSENRKRVHSDVVHDEGDPATASSSKRLKKQTSDTTLLSLSDDVLLIIFTHLSTAGSIIFLF